MKDKELPNHIQEYVSDTLGENDFRTLFEAEEKSVDLRTDLEFRELAIINIIKFNNAFLKDHGLNDVFTDFIDSYLRLKISLDRKSRGEFVDINRKERFEQNLRRMNDFSNLVKTKE